MVKLTSKLTLQLKKEANQASTNVPVDFTALTMDIKMTVAALAEEKQQTVLFTINLRALSNLFF